MSLGEVILEIVEEMVKDSECVDSPSEDLRIALRMHAKQLKVAVKAAEGQQQTASYPTNDIPGGGQLFIHPDAQHFQMVEQARKELREQKRKAEGQESYDNRMARCEGGPADGDMVPISVEMPAGAKAVLDGCVYVLSAQGTLVPEEKP